MQEENHQTKNEPEPTFESLLSLAGSFGRWQWGILMAGSAMSMLLIIHHIGYIFHSAEPDHWCRVDELKLTNWSLDQIKEMSLPKEERDGQHEVSRCNYFRRNYSALAQMTYEEAVDYEAGKNVSQTVCESWEYDDSSFASTTATEWDLICDWTWMRPTIQSVYMLGVLFPAFTFGPAADRFGRKRALSVAVFVLIPILFACAFAPNYTTLLVLRFFTGLVVMSCYTSCYCLLLEVVDPNRRGLVTLIYDTGISVGVVGLAGLSFILSDWRHLHIALGTASFSFLLWLWILPESPRWLMLKGRFCEAEVILRRVAKWNKKELPSSEELCRKMQEIRDYEVKREARSYEGCAGLLEKVKRVFFLWRTPEMRSRSLKIYWTWFVVSLVVSGRTLLAVRLPVSSHLIVTINGCVGGFTRLAIIWPLGRYGRKPLSLFGYIMAAFGMFAFAFIPRDMPYLSWIILSLGSLGVEMNFTIIYVHTAELFPTETRAVALFAGSVFARVASMSTPYIVDLFGANNRIIPISIFATASVSAALACWFLPETNGRELPDTVMMVEACRKNATPKRSKRKTNNGMKKELDAAEMSPLQK